MALVALLVLGLAAGCSDAAPSSGSSGPAPEGSAYALDVGAHREAYTTDASSPVIHDTETNAFVPQGDRLFAATDQWEYPGPHAYGQVLVKDQTNGSWKVFEQTQGLRVQALDSFSIPSDQGLGRGRSLLVTQAVLDGQSVVQWALDGAPAFAPADAHALSSPSDDVRQAFVSIRTIAPSPFDDDRLHYVGYDCNFIPADGTAWVGTSSLDAIHSGSNGKEKP